MAFARVQGNIFTSAAAGSTVPVTLGATVTSGNFICGIVTWDNIGGTPTLTSVTDDKSNTYNISSTLSDAPNGQGSAIFWLGNITNGPITITANLSGSAGGSRCIIATEFSGGFAAADPKDLAPVGQFQTTPGTTTDAVTSGSMTTLTSGDMIYGASCNTSGATNATAGSSFTLLTDQTSAVVFMNAETLTQAAAGAVAATFTQGTNNNRATFALAIKPAVSTFTWSNMENSTYTIARLISDRKIEIVGY